MIRVLSACAEKDTTLFVEQSLKEFAKALFEAIALVILVIFIFLQDWDTTLIPVVTVPLALIGTRTSVFVKAFKFSINLVTLFGLTLATGMVVDDAIIVVENISLNLGERNATVAGGLCRNG